ncbi:hypothetical protein [Pseudalkalibacillus caeni]|uniref:Uncharacterized protein n=1 Tax=Exobacillus caeni TaxID=2574798 RepID=A0A5R9FAE4_9BACL|nr:hypothetical protein [Pseudalkalibacillus caeni]TLS37833.1 hypothetical protein FCL54_08420 [Pseudalkalibacillus caeni]
MGKTVYWAVIFLTLIVNVVALHHTVEAYFGREHEEVFVYTIVGVISSIICFVAYLMWRKAEYKKADNHN